MTIIIIRRDKLSSVSVASPVQLCLEDPKLPITLPTRILFLLVPQAYNWDTLREGNMTQEAMLALSNYQLVMEKRIKRDLHTDARILALLQA